jgi:hypothetical protein
LLVYLLQTLPSADSQGALIAAIASVVVAILTSGFYFINARNERRDQRDRDARLKKLEASLAQKGAERDARRDYEYEARKRLYDECEPLMFQLVERGQHAVRRIEDFVDYAGTGQLSTGRGAALHEEYFLRMSVYRLFLPLSIFAQMERRLTLVDLSLDTRTFAFYQLGKVLFSSFNDDIAIAAASPEIEGYDPMAGVQQGLPFGDLSGIMDLMFTPPMGRETWRYPSFGEFETLLDGVKADSREGQSIEAVFTFVRSLDPRKRPVMWRMLIAQFQIYDALSRLAAMKGDDVNADTIVVLLRPADPKQRERFDWRRAKTEASDDEVLVQPFAAARQYILDRVAPAKQTVKAVASRNDASLMR